MWRKWEVRRIEERGRREGKGGEGERGKGEEPGRGGSREERVKGRRWIK